MTEKRQGLIRTRKAAGFTQESLAHALGVDPSTVGGWERGAAEPLPYKRAKLATLLGVSAARLDTLLLNEPLNLPSTAPPPEAACAAVDVDGADGGIRLDGSYVESLRARIQELVRLDVRFGGDHTAGIALGLFRSVHRKLGRVECDPTVETDLYSTVGELGELAGWLLFDAGRHELVRRVNHEALNLLRMAGDRSTEILTLQNMAMHAGHLKRPGEALRLTQMVLEQNRLSPRLSALFLVRKARALALGGDGGNAQRTFAEARSHYLDGVRDSDPAWAWWIDDRELAWHEAMILGDGGDWRQAVDTFQRSGALTPAGAIRSLYVNTASVLYAQTKVRAWAEMPGTLEQLMPYADEVGSTRTATILLHTLPIIERSTAPADVRESATELRRRLVDAGYSAG